MIYKRKKIDRKIRYFFSTFIVVSVVFLIMQAILPNLIFSDMDSQTKIDAVLVLDVSKSMISSDPEKLSFEAMKMFIDLANYRGDKIGIVAYSDKIEREKALLTIQSDEDKIALHNFISQIEIVGFYTDIPVGLKEATRVLSDGGDDQHEPIVIILTDGRNDLTRPENEAEKDLQDSINAGYPIYTIGLNANGKVDKEYLERISMETGAQSYITGNVEELLQILTNIFADFYKVNPISADKFEATGDFESVIIPVSSQNVLEANILILSNKPVETMLFDPDNNEIEIPSDDIYYSLQNKYSLIKIISPEQGNWELKVKGVKEDKIAINIVYNYEIQLLIENLTESKGPYNRGDEISIKSYLLSEGKPVEGTELYEDMDASLIIENSEGEIIYDEPMVFDQDGFRAKVLLEYEEGNYEIIAWIEAKTFYRESEPLKISIKPEIVETGTGTVTETVTGDVEVGEDGNWKKILYYSLGGVLLFALIIFFVLRKIRGIGRFIGHVILIITEGNKENRPITKRLSNYKNRVNLFDLLGRRREFIETKKITFLPGKQESLTLQNLSRIKIIKDNEEIDTKNGYQLKSNDKINIVLDDLNKVINLEYRL